MPVQPTYPGVPHPGGAEWRSHHRGRFDLRGCLPRPRPPGTPERPVLCLSMSDFERSFSSRYASSDLARADGLFFTNGGQRCYVMRIASGATVSEVTLKSEGENDVLLVKARDPGLEGDSLRVGVAYNGPEPEATFNLEVFRETTDSQGRTTRSDVEVYPNLSMDPDSPRYAESLVNQSSRLVELEDVAANLPAGAQAISRSGRPIPHRIPTIFRSSVRTLFGADPGVAGNRFEINVAGGGWVEVDLSPIDFESGDLNSPGGVTANLPGAIEDLINPNLPGGSAVTVSFETGPGGPTDEDNQNSRLLQIASADGDVQIRPASTDDLAGPLLLGTAQGGLEVSRYADHRPAPNGVVFKRSELVAFAGREQTAFDTLTLGGTDLSLGTSLVTVPTAGSRMYQDGQSPSVNGNSDGVREKWRILARAINDQRTADPSFRWRAEVWGSRLAILPVAGGANVSGTVATSGADGVDVSEDFEENVRYYSLGPSGQGDLQAPAGAPASDGAAPTLTEYRAAFEILRKEVDLFNLLILPRDADHSAAVARSLLGPASVFCQEERAFLLIDPPAAWTDDVQTAALDPGEGVNGLRLGLVKDHAAVYYPDLRIRENGLEVDVGPSGAVAGLMARTDSERGVWKAPAGLDADVRGVEGLKDRLSDLENGVLNQRGINALRVFPSGVVSWGARTLDGDDDFGSEWKYVPVRRLALYIEESLYRGTQWVVFEPNDEPLWAQIRLNVGAFMQTLFRQGAFQGQTPREAYLVKCDRDTTTQNDVDRGIVNIVVGFAPLKPAEFVIITIRQLAGQTQA